MVRDVAFASQLPEEGRKELQAALRQRIPRTTNNTDNGRKWQAGFGDALEVWEKRDQASVASTNDAAEEAGEILSDSMTQ